MPVRRENERHYSEHQAMLFVQALDGSSGRDGFSYFIFLSSEIMTPALEVTRPC